MKASGAPETGDLVMVKAKECKAGYASDWAGTLGLIVDCVGIRCEVQWPPHIKMPHWFARTDLEVVGDVNESR